MSRLIDQFLDNQRMRGMSDRTIARRAWSLGLWSTHVGGDLEHATFADVEAFLSTYPGAQTRYSIRSDINQLYRFLQRRGVVEQNPVTVIDSPRVPKRGPSPVSAADVLRLIDANKGQTRLAIMLGAYAGLRISEIAALRGEDIDLVGKVLVVRQGKGAKDATVPLAVELAAELVNWPRSGRLFGASDGQAIGKRIRTAYRRLGIVARPHDLRHSFGTTAAHRSGDLRLVQKLMRHDSIATTERYVNWWPAGAGTLDAMYTDGQPAADGAAPRRRGVARVQRRHVQRLDVAPMGVLAVRSADLIARIDAGEPVPREEVRALEADVDVICDGLLVALTAATGDRPHRSGTAREISDGLRELVLTLTGVGEAGWRWDESPAGVDEQCEWYTNWALERGEDPDEIAAAVAELRGG